MRNASDHRFAVELEYEPQHAMRRRMLWADVDDHVLASEIRLGCRRRLESEG